MANPFAPNPFAPAAGASPFAAAANPFAPATQAANPFAAAPAAANPFAAAANPFAPKPAAANPFAPAAAANPFAAPAAAANPFAPAAVPANPFAPAPAAANPFAPAAAANPFAAPTAAANPFAPAAAANPFAPAAAAANPFAPAATNPFAAAAAPAAANPFAPAAGSPFAVPGAAPSGLPPFTAPVQISEPDAKGGSGTKLNFHSITAMTQYQGQSFEELRMLDYSQNRKVKQAGFASPFGAAAPGAVASPFAAPAAAANPFAPAAATNPFAPKPASPFASPFAATSAAPSIFGAVGASTSPFAAGAAPANPFAPAAAANPFAPAAPANPFAPATGAANPFAPATGAANPFAPAAAANPFAAATGAANPFAAAAPNPFAPGTGAANPFAPAAAANPFAPAAAANPFAAPAANPFAAAAAKPAGNPFAPAAGAWGAAPAPAVDVNVIAQAMHGALAQYLVPLHQQMAAQQQQAVQPTASRLTRDPVQKAPLPLGSSDLSSKVERPSHSSLETALSTARGIAPSPFQTRHRVSGGARQRSLASRETALNSVTPLSAKTPAATPLTAPATRGTGGGGPGPGGMSTTTTLNATLNNVSSLVGPSPSVLNSATKSRLRIPKLDAERPGPQLPSRNLATTPLKHMSQVEDSLVAAQSAMPLVARSPSHDVTLVPLQPDTEHLVPKVDAKWHMEPRLEDLRMRAAQHGAVKVSKLVVTQAAGTGRDYCRVEFNGDLDLTSLPLADTLQLRPEALGVRIPTSLRANVDVVFCLDALRKEVGDQLQHKLPALQAKFNAEYRPIWDVADLRLDQQQGTLTYRMNLANT